MKDGSDLPIRRIIDRPRLLDQLERTNSRTILLIAPAGYGKTTLLRQWAQRNQPDCWYTADIGSSDLAQLATSLAAALEPVSPGLKDDISQVVGALSNPGRQAHELVDALSTRLAKAQLETVVFDDYHLLTQNAAAETFVHELFSRLNVRLLCGSRLRPSWATARAEIYGDVFELGIDELALTAEETAELLVHTPAPLMSGLLDQANGWPAIIGLVALARLPRHRTPGDAVSSALYRFFAEELFTAAPARLQWQLIDMALLPNLSRDVMDVRFGDGASGALTDAVTRGFATLSEHGHDLHPLIREYLLSKLSLEVDAAGRVTEGVALSLRFAAWDNAFALMKRFGRADLVDGFLEAAFMPLARHGRVSTLDQVGDFARSQSVDFSPAVTLIDAELAHRNGLFERANALGAHSAKGLQATHALAARAHWVAGEGACQMANYSVAKEHFARARDAAKDDDDTRDALWGLMRTSIFSEAFTLEVAGDLEKRRDASPVDLVLATTAAMLLRRYDGGFAKPLDIQSALRNRDAVPDPRVRTSFMNILSFVGLLRADYESARQSAEWTLRQASDYHLAWVIPSAEWNLAAASLGLRDFGRAERWLQRVERVAVKFDDPHITLNAATLRARFLLAMQRPTPAYDALAEEDRRPVSPSMRAEVAAMRALVLAVMGDARTAELEAKRASGLTVAIDVHALVACARAICRPSETKAAQAFTFAKQFGIWDPLISAARADPDLLERLVKAPTRRALIQSVLGRSNDFDLARRAGIAIGRRPRPNGSPLSNREREVLDLVRQGLTNKQIGEALFISQGTAKVHVRHILEKMGVRTRTEAATRLLLDDEL